MILIPSCCGPAFTKVQGNNNDRNPGQAEKQELHTLHQATGRELSARKSASSDD
jgi:hypothetical protein